MPASELPDEEILSAFLRQYYRPGRFIPQQILLPTAMADRTLIEEWLTEGQKKKVRLLVPGAGDKRRLLQMARENAEKFLLPEIGNETETLLENLRHKLRLVNLPRRIEAFDISNFQGQYAVGSMVLFVNGQPSKEGYRHFKIQTVVGADDYGMMEEILLRRYRKALAGGDLPDLALLDGGRGQLNVALISLAKERIEPQPRSGRKKTTVRNKAARQSVLEEVAGIGPIRRRELLQFFGTPEKVQTATVERLRKVPRMNQKLAQAVYDFFNRPGKKEPHIRG